MLQTEGRRAIFHRRERGGCDPAAIAPCSPFQFGPCRAKNAAGVHLAPVDSGPCEAVIAGSKPEQLSEIEACDSEPGTLCHKLFVDDRLITTVTTGYVSPGPPPGQIVTAKLNSLIIMGHEIID